ncbi:AmmeMemoRadiSam system radical SAM enzyme [Patescibacteria group bacterium]|nr:AmmeMemoRadiSam system radical SAM enzyme [Patescibacteria group bacterium]
MKKADFFQKINDNKVKCTLCNQGCVIADNHRGLCGVRENRKGILYSLVYGKVIAQHVDPIEKKPFYHFLSGSQSYSIATVGCNLKCMHCQNADISQSSKEGFFYDKYELPGENVTPQQIVEEAKNSNCQSISYTYTEPTVFYEFALDCMKLAKKEGLKNTWVTNGYTSTDALTKVAEFLDAVNVDLKFFKETTYQQICGAKLLPVLNNLRLLKKLGVWVEVTTLIIPKQNDSIEELTNIANFINNDLGSETPWHVTAFSSAYKMINTPQTSQRAILKAVEIGKTAGLKYVYSGNIMDNETSITYCPKCNEKIIERLAYQTNRLDDNGKCSKCKTIIDGVLI